MIDPNQTLKVSETLLKNGPPVGLRTLSGAFALCWLTPQWEHPEQARDSGAPE